MSGVRSLRYLVAAAVVAGCTSKTTPDRPPVARAGDDVIAFRGDSVTLDGSASSDPDTGATLTFTWRELSGPAVATPAGATLTFTASSAGTYTFALDVSDGKDVSSDVVSVEARPDLGASVIPLDSDFLSGRAPVVAYFSAPIRPWMAASSLTVDDVTDPLNPVAVQGNVTVDDGNTAAVFTPLSDWADTVKYRVTVAGALGLDGAPLRLPVTSSFTGSALDTIPPHVVLAFPADNATAQPLSSTVDLIFSEPLDPATVTSALSLAGTSAEDGAVILSAGGTHLSFIPADTSVLPIVPHALAPATAFTATVLASAADLAGNPLGTAFATHFTTKTGSDTTAPSVLSVSPIPGANGVSVKLPVVVTFSEPIDPATLTSAMVLGTGGAGSSSVTGTLTTAMGNRVAIFTPSKNLRTAQQYDFTLVAAGVKDLSGNALGANFAAFFKTGNAPPPTVAVLSPPSGNVAATTTIQIFGSDFVATPNVLVNGGGVLAGNVTFLAQDTLQVDLTIAPAAPVNVRSLTVINPDGQTSNASAFATLAQKPVITSLVPPLADRNTTTNVTVNGNFFQNGATLDFGAGVTVNSVTYVSPQQLTANITIGAGAFVGTRDITVTNPDLQVMTLLAGFNVKVEAPVLTSIDITSGRRKDALTVTLTGAFFQPAPTVSFGSGIAVASVTYVSAIRVDVDIDIAVSAAQGTRSVTLTNSDGQASTLTNVFTVNRALPTVSSITPNAGSRQSAGFGVTIGGADFDCSAAPGTVPLVTLNDASLAVSAVSCGGSTSEFATSLTATLTLTAGSTLGAHTVSVKNPGDSTFGNGVGLFNVRAEAPTFTSALPNPKQGETRNVTVLGNFLQATPAVTTTGATVNNVSFVDAQTLLVNVTVPFTTASGAYSLSVINPDGQSVSGAITVDSAPAPIVSSCTPAIGTQNTPSLDVIINGQNFEPGAPLVTFSGTGITVNTITFQNPTAISVNITISGGAAKTARDVTVTNTASSPNQAATGTGVFTVTGPVPTITALSAVTGAQGATVSGVQINGTNFLIGGAAPSFGAGITVAVVSTAGTTQITVNLTISAGATTGLRDVTVTNTDGASATSTGAFTVTAAGGGPTISAVIKDPDRNVPAAGKASRQDTADSIRTGQSKLFHVIGSNFQSGAGLNVTVAGAGITVSGITFVNSTRIDVTLAVACGTAVGRRDVTVTNPPPAVGNGLSGTLTNGLLVRDGLVLNEVVLQPRKDRGVGGGSGANDQFVELFNGSGCTRDITDFRMEFFFSNNSVGSFIWGITATGNERYNAVTCTGANARNHLCPGAYAGIIFPGNATLNTQNDLIIFLVQMDKSGNLIDKVEIGNDPELDGNGDGAPCANCTGSTSATNDESVARAPNGMNTGNDINDWYQTTTKETVVGGGTFRMTATDEADNCSLAGNCPTCSDGIDNDGDGWVDLLDPSCANNPLGNENSQQFSGSACNTAAANATNPNCVDGFDTDATK